TDLGVSGRACRHGRPHELAGRLEEGDSNRPVSRLRFIQFPDIETNDSVGNTDLTVAIVARAKASDGRNFDFFRYALGQIWWKTSEEEREAPPLPPTHRRHARRFLLRD